MKTKRDNYVTHSIWLTLLIVFIFPAQSVAVWVPAKELPSETRIEHEYVPGEVLVKFREKANIVNAKQAEALLKIKKARHLTPPGKTKKMGLWWQVTLEGEQDIHSAISQLKAYAEVEHAEPNYILSAQRIPNDPRYSEQWGLHNTQQAGGINDADIDAPEAWDAHVGNSKVIVAVIDTGVDMAHEDLANNIWQNPGEIPANGIDDDGNGYIDDVYGYDFINRDSDPYDDHGHGTHVAGTIAAVGDNALGVVGVSWKSRIMALKFLGSGGSGTIADAITAVNYAVAKGAKVINASWGGGGYSQGLYDAIAAANNAGVLFVAAAGNSGANTDITPAYPASYNLANIISVAATDSNDSRASFSNFGATSVDLGAPGVNILSTVPKISCALCSPTGYSALSGTSMAAPHVTGVVALLQAKFPLMTMSNIKSRILTSVDSRASLTGNTVAGGRLNAMKTLSPAGYLVVADAWTKNITNGDSATFNLTINSTSLTNKQLSLSLGGAHDRNECYIFIGNTFTASSRIEQSDGDDIYHSAGKSW